MAKRCALCSLILIVVLSAASKNALAQQRREPDILLQRAQELAFNTFKSLVCKELMNERPNEEESAHQDVVTEVELVIEGQREITFRDKDRENLCGAIQLDEGPAPFTSTHHDLKLFVEREYRIAKDDLALEAIAITDSFAPNGDAAARNIAGIRRVTDDFLRRIQSALQAAGDDKSAVLLPRALSPDAGRLVDAYPHAAIKYRLFSEWFNKVLAK